MYFKDAMSKFELPKTKSKIRLFKAYNVENGDKLVLPVDGILLATSFNAAIEHLINNETVNIELNPMITMLIIDLPIKDNEYFNIPDDTHFNSETGLISIELATLIYNLDVVDLCAKKLCWEVDESNEHKMITEMSFEAVDMDDAKLVKAVVPEKLLEK